MLPRTPNPIAIFSIVSVVILYLGFAFNIFKATDYVYYYDSSYSFMRDAEVFPEILSDDAFLTFDRWSESLIMGRLVKSRKDGLFSAGGFVGRFYDIPEPTAGLDERKFGHAYQYVLYLDESTNSEIKQFGPYKSQFGGQAFLLGILDRIMGGKNTFKLKFYYHLMAALSAAVIFMIIFWFAGEFGLITGWLLVVSFSLFCYPTLFAKNLWWTLWAFYIPFLIFLYFLRKEERSPGDFSHGSFFFAGFCSMMIKIFFNGFEFITTIYLMPLIPLVYYSIKNRWNVRIFFIRTVFGYCGISLAIMTSLLLLSLQFVAAGERFDNGLNHIQERFMLRTQINRTTGHEISITQNSKTTLNEVLKYYIYNPPVVRLQNFGINRTLNVAHFLIIFISLSFILTFVIKVARKRTMPSNLKALIISVWLAAVPPLSWFVIFKQHSIIHKTHDAIVWYMPFMFYGIALCGIFLKEMLQRNPIYYENEKYLEMH